MAKSWHFLMTLLMVVIVAFQQTTLHKTDVPPHPWDIILNRPTGSSVAASLMIYRDATASLEYGLTPGLYPQRTPPQVFRSGIPASCTSPGPAPSRPWPRT